MGNIYNYIHKLNDCDLSFLFHDLHPIYPIFNEGRFDNLVKSNFLALFPYLKHVEIDTDSGKYRFNLISFLEIINDNSKDIRYKIIGYEKSDIRARILYRYESEGWNIRYMMNAVIITRVKNYDEISSIPYILWILDLIMTGSDEIEQIEAGDITKEDVSTLQQLFDAQETEMKTEEIESKDSNLTNQFVSYRNNQEKIILDLDNVYNYFCVLNHCKLSFLFTSLAPYSIHNEDNLLNSNFLSLFKNVNYVKIDTHNGIYKFDLLSFLDIINNNSRDIRYVLIGYDKEDITTTISTRYNHQKWAISCWAGSIFITDNELYGAFASTLNLFEIITNHSVKNWTMDREEIKKEDILTLQQLIESQYKIEDVINPLIIKQFNVYCNSTTNIVLDMCWIDKYIANLGNCDVSFIFNNLDSDSIEIYKRNLLNPNFLLLFKNLNQVKIDTKSGRFKFDILSFLVNVINKIPTNIRYEIITGHDSWDLNSSIVSTYKSKGWCIKYVENAKILICPL